MNYNKLIKDFLREARNIQHIHIVEHSIEDAKVKVSYTKAGENFKTAIQLFDLITFAYGKISVN